MLLYCPPVETLTTYIYTFWFKCLTTGGYMNLQHLLINVLNDLFFFFFLQIWSIQRGPTGWTAALLPRVRRKKRRKMRKRRGCRKGAGPNESAVKAAVAPLCARCATFSWTPAPRPRSTIEGRRTRGGCADWQRLLTQVGMHRFYVLCTSVTCANVDSPADLQ